MRDTKKKKRKPIEVVLRITHARSVPSNDNDLLGNARQKQLVEKNTLFLAILSEHGGRGHTKSFENGMRVVSKDADCVNKKKKHANKCRIREAIIYSPRESSRNRVLKKIK